MSEGIGSHSTLLTAAFSVTTGPVLELGAGLGSTPMLHGLCGSSKRELLTLDSSGVWLNKFETYRRPWHVLKFVKKFINLEQYTKPWGLTFVDHGIIDERRHSIESLAHVPIVIVHDTCHSRLYHYDEAFADYRYRFDLKLFGPQTSAISNTVDVQAVFEEFDL